MSGASPPKNLALFAGCRTGNGTIRAQLPTSRCPLMGWSGRAPAPPASEAGKGAKDKEHAMSQTPNTAIAVIGIDIGKNSFHVVGHDARGAIVLRQKWSRGQVEARLANIPPCLIGMEACVGAHHLSRKLASLGHDARLLRMLRVIEELRGDWRRLDQRIDGLSGEIEALARQDQACSRLMTVPGIGPIISSAMVAAIGTGDVFSKGRDFGAWLGLVPKQISTGDRTILGKISRRGNRYLRVLFVQAAWVVLVRIKNWERYGLKSWIEAAKRRLHHNVLAIALANKLARIAWAVLAKGRAFELTRTDDAGVRPA